MQYFIYRYGRCVTLEENPQQFLATVAAVLLGLSVFGFLGSVTSVIVTSSRRLRSSTSVFLSALGVYDALFTASNIVSTLLRITQAKVLWLSSVSNCLWLLTKFTSAYVIAFISMERSLSLAKPFFVVKYKSTRLAVRLNVVIFSIGVLINIPQVFNEFVYLSVEGGCDGGGDQYQMNITSFGRLYSLYVSPSVNLVIPFLIVVVMNAWFGWNVVVIRRRQSVELSSQTRPGRSGLDEGLLRLTVGLTIWYTVCWLIPGAYYIYRFPNPTILNPTLGIKVWAITEILIVTNATMNSIFYFLLWRQFRSAFVSLCRNCCASCPCAYNVTGTSAPSEQISSTTISETYM